MVPMTFHKKKTELKARHMARCFEFMFTRNVMKRDVGLQQVKSSNGEDTLTAPTDAVRVRACCRVPCVGMWGH